MRHGLLRSLASSVAIATTAGGLDARARVIRVPEDAPTIQDGINLAGNGDEVVVADGTYTGVGNKHIGFRGKRITVRSASGDPTRCIIDCEGSGRGFFFQRDETRESVLDGFTITNGCVDFRSPGGTPWGGGILCEFSSPTIRNCIVRQNTVLDDTSCSGERPLDEPRRRRGRAQSRPHGSGGGICCFRSSALVMNCMIVDNFSQQWGGGIQCFDATPTFVNCTVTDNEAEIGSGGVTIHQESVAVFVHCTISRNTVRIPFAGGLYSSSSDTVVANCIVHGNQESPEIVLNHGTLVVSYTDAGGGYPGVGNIDRPPRFVDPDGGDYRIGPGSPCIDAANNDAVPAGIDVDLDGNPRFIDDPETKDTGKGQPPIVDMGAYEFQVGPCLGDFDGDEDVGFADLLILLSAWGPCSPAHDCFDQDLDGNGAADFGDLLILLDAWGPCP